MTSAPTAGLRRAILIAALLNLAYFGVEFVIALEIDSFSLLADSAVSRTPPSIS